MPSPPAVGDAGEAGIDLVVAVEGKGKVGITSLVEECTDVLLLLGSEGDGVDSSRLLRLRIAGYIARAVGSGAGREV